MIGIALMVVESLLVLANLYRLKRQTIEETPAEFQTVMDQEEPVNDSNRRALDRLTKQSGTAPETVKPSVEEAAASAAPPIIFGNSSFYSPPNNSGLKAIDRLPEITPSNLLNIV